MVEVDAERTQEDTEYFVLGVDVVVEDDIDAVELAAVVRALDVAGPHVEADSYGAQVRLAQHADAADGE